MSVLRLYSGGTGRLQLDSTGELTDQQSDLARRDFKSGVLLYVDESQQGLRSQVLAYRQSPEQFIAMYRSDTERDLLAAFASDLKNEIEAEGWQVYTEDEWTDVIISAGVASESVHQLEDRIREIIERGEEVDLGVPDSATALGLVEYCLELLSEPTVAVCREGRVAHLDEADVVIQPKETLDTITPVGETAESLRRDRIESDYETLTDELSTLNEQVQRTVDAPQRTNQMFVSILREAGMHGEAWTVTAESPDQTGLGQAAKPYAGGSLVVSVALGILVMNITDISPGPLSASVFGIPVWLLAVGATGMLSLSFVIERAVSSDPKRGSPPDHVVDQELIATITEILSRLARMTDDVEYRKVLERALDDYAVSITESTSDTGGRYLAPIVGIAAGLLLGLGVLGVLSAQYARQHPLAVGVLLLAFGGIGAINIGWHLLSRS